MTEDTVAPYRERIPIRAHCHAKSKGAKGSVRVVRAGVCALCPATWSLTKHHLFGSGENLTAQVCHNCHRQLHLEIESGMVGPFGRHLLQILAQVFPITAPLPEWNTND